MVDHSRREDNGRKGGRKGKVEILLEEYELTDVGEELEIYWTARDESHKSLRELADYFNQKLLENALSEAGTEPLEGETEMIYRVLTDETISTGMRNQARRRLKRTNIDIGSIRQDFVSRQAIHTYLTKKRNAEYTPEDTSQSSIETVQKLTERTKRIVESKVEQFQRNRGLDIGNFHVFVDVRIMCEECGNQYKLPDLFERNSCDCTSVEEQVD